MDYRKWKKKTLKNKRYARAYIKLLEKFNAEYEKLFYEFYQVIPSSPKEIKKERERVINLKRSVDQRLREQNER